MAQSTGQRLSSAASIEWSLETLIDDPPGFSGQSASGRVGDRAGTLVSKFASRGAKAERISAGATKYIVRASGADDVESLRTLLHTVARPEFDLLGGVTEMEIESPAPGKDGLVLILESNRSTGYTWQVASDKGAKQSVSHAYERHTPGYGAPERQMIRIAAPGTGSVKLVYKRPWEDSAPTRRVRLRLAALPATLNLSNPGASRSSAAASKGAGHDEVFPSVPADALPTHFDWRDQGIVPPVRDQGACGSCWAFGTVGIMESSLRMNGSADVDLSEQFLISCNVSGWDCSGGWTAHAYHYDTPGRSQTTIGAVQESIKPYKTANGTCATNYLKSYSLTGWQFITGSEYSMPAVDQLKSAIYTYGPVTAGVCAGEWWNWYSGGVFGTDETSSCPPSPGGDCDTHGCTNHQIILVGWDETDPDPSNHYWILRNSWGDGWGIDGYMHIKYGTSRVGEGASWVTANPSLCTYMITSPSAVSFNPGGGSATVKIGVTGTGCTEPQIAIGGGAENWLEYSWLAYKNNSGSLRVKTAATGSSKERTGTITIGGGPVLSITQKGKRCSFGVFSPPGASYKKNVHAGSFIVVTRPSDCEWTASVVPPADTWIHVTSGGSGAGGDGVAYSVDANPGTTRTGKISVGLTSRAGVTKMFGITQSSRSE